MTDLLYKFFLLRELGFNYPYNRDYDNFLIDCLVTGIRSYRYDIFDGEVVFNNNIRYTFWNSNKFYAWLQTAAFQDMTTFQPGYGIGLTRFSGRPSAKTMYFFNRALKNWLNANPTSRQESTLIELQRYDEQRRRPIEIAVQPNPLMANIPQVEKLTPDEAKQMIMFLEKIVEKEETAPKLTKLKYIAES